MLAVSKNILITVSQDSIARNVLHSFVMDALLGEPSLSVYLLVPAEAEKKYRREFDSTRVRILGHTPQVNFFDKILRYLCRHNLRTDTIMTDQRTRLLIDRNYTSFAVKRSLIFLFGKSRFFHELIRFVAKFRRASAKLTDLLKKLEVNLVVATDVQDNLDIELMRAARDLKIKLVGLVRSWDNLVSEGGLIQIIPDRLIVWNPYLAGQAISLHHIPESRVIAAGIPHYDWYLKKELLISREEFFSKLGLDPLKKTILFTGLGDYFAPHEAEVVEIIADAFRTGELPSNLQMLFRPHPAYDVHGKERLATLPRTIFDHKVSPFTDADKSDHETQEEKIAHQLNSIYHSDVIVTSPSSMVIDAVPFDKPAVGVAFDGKSAEPYWNSVKRYIKGYTHIKDLVAYGAFPVAYNRAQLISLIKEILENPNKFKDGREKILDEFIWKLDGGSGERFAKAILEMI